MPNPSYLLGEPLLSSRCRLANMIKPGFLNFSEHICAIYQACICRELYFIRIELENGALKVYGLAICVNWYKLLSEWILWRDTWPGLTFNTDQMMGIPRLGT